MKITRRQALAGSMFGLGGSVGISCALWSGIAANKTGVYYKVPNLHRFLQRHDQWRAFDRIADDRAVQVEDLLHAGFGNDLLGCALRDQPALL